MNFYSFGVSIITDDCTEGKMVNINHEEVLLAAQKAEPKVR